MTALEDPDTIEAKVGAKRSKSKHLARFVSEDERIYLMHSAQCVEITSDLRECAFSLALDQSDESLVTTRSKHLALSRGRRLKPIRVLHLVGGAL